MAAVERKISYRDFMIPTGGYIADTGIMPSALGIDIGARNTGYAIAVSRKDPDRKTIVIHVAEAGELSFATATHTGGRSGKELNEFRQLVGEIILAEGWYHSLIAVGIEAPILFPKGKGANWRETGEVLGVLRAAVCQYASAMNEYLFHPATVKAAFKLEASADKAAVAARLKQMIGLEFDSDHATDAVGIALVTLWRHALADKPAEFGGAVK